MSSDDNEIDMPSTSKEPEGKKSLTGQRGGSKPYRHANPRLSSSSGYGGKNNIRQRLRDGRWQGMEPNLRDSDTATAAGRARAQE